MATEKGISIIEIIFSIGVIVLVITGVVSLMVKSTGLKTNTLQRKKASEVAEMVIENLVNQKNNDRDGFWSLTPTLGVIENYTYDVGYTQVTTGLCSDIAPATCVNAIINIGWGNSQTLTVKRFFSK